MRPEPGWLEWMGLEHLELEDELPRCFFTCMSGIWAAMLKDRFSGNYWPEGWCVAFWILWSISLPSQGSQTSSWRLRASSASMSREQGGSLIVLCDTHEPQRSHGFISTVFHWSKQSQTCLNSRKGNTNSTSRWKQCQKFCSYVINHLSIV